MIKNSMIYTIGTILPKIVVFLMLPIYMMYLTPAEYGTIQMINALVGVVSIFFLTSLRASVTRLYIDYSDNKDSFTFTIFSFLILFAFFLGTLLYFMKPLLGGIVFNEIPVDPYYLFLIVLSALSVFPVVPLSMMRIQEKAWLYVSMNIIETLLIISFTLYLLIFQDMGALGGVLALVIAKSIMAVLYTTYTISSTGFHLKRMKILYLSSALLIGIPLIPHFLAGWVNNLADRLIIENILGLEVLGIYSIGAQFNMAILLLVNAFNMAFAPRYYKMMKAEKFSQKNFDKIFTVLFSSITTVALVMYILVPIMIRLFGSSEYDADYSFIGFLLGGAIWHLAYIFVVAALIYNKKPGYIAVSTVISAIFNILLNLALLPILGILGAAIATYVAMMVQFLLINRIANKLTYHTYQLSWKHYLPTQILYTIVIIVDVVLDKIILFGFSSIVLILFCFKSFIDQIKVNK
ncbi:lipopolysaccharide biosynthesis protein [Salipaludibacillus sp. HK11]|uniref:lipopolysaccharide biosynthesis protein n=1 Tax=Salipaludibacillus sp. HK11 TaxID=3394320 RepID=UPI0039FBE5F5